MDIVDGTSVDGPGLRTSVYMAGCAHRCPGCHNPSTWDFNAGEDWASDRLLHHIFTENLPVTLTGGDPIYQAEALVPLVKAIREHGLGIWCYTGFTFEELQTKPPSTYVNEMLKHIDVLVDGPYIESLRDTSLLFRGSSNQRLIDVRRSLEAGETILYDTSQTFRIY